MATRKSAAGPLWPFDDDHQRDLMAASSGRRTALAPAGPFGLSMATDRSWETDRQWATDAQWTARGLRPPRLPAAERSAHGGAARRVAFGYHPDLRDARDFAMRSVPPADSPDADQRRRLRDQLDTVLVDDPLPPRVNSIPWCSPVEDQGSLGSCTAQAVVGLVEYMQRRSGSEHVDGSRLFVYKVARRLQGWTGDTGCYLRTTLKTVAAFGVPPESYWPYVIERFEEEPSAFLYSFAANYQAIGYARLDPPGLPATQVLDDVRRALASGLGVVFGFPVYSSAREDGEFPLPVVQDKLLGGHAVMAVGYDDSHAGNGALLVRNSWGAAWGQQGYGFIPYGYVLQGLAQDFWTITKAEWLDLAEFG